MFYLGFVDGLLTIFFINLLGTLPVAFFSTFGPVYGMRQMVLSRFFFGYYGVKVIAIFNCLACLGWSAVNVIVGKFPNKHNLTASRLTFFRRTAHSHREQ